MDSKKPIFYIPAREYLPGPDKQYDSVFLREGGEMFYLRIDDSDRLVSGNVPHSLHIYRQTKVIHRRNNEPGILGVHTEEVKDLEAILPQISEELSKRRMGGIR